MDTTSQCLFVGLPESGKTTFLAALWYFVRHSEGRSGLVIDSLPEQRQYLNSISSLWMQGKKQIHTPGENIIDVTLSLKDAVSGVDSHLYIPDLSGEIFIRHWVDRRWSHEFHVLASNICGVIVFIHPNRIEAPATIQQINASNRDLDFESNAVSSETTGNGDSSERGDPIPFDPWKAPPQVILIDQLQCLLGPPCNHSQMRLSLVISAWDLVEDEQLLPGEWLGQHAPMLHNFIRANNGRIASRVFGISAEGVDDSKPESKAELLLLPDPIERIKVIDDSNLSHDITLPLQWLIHT